jgi:O-antigen/teichoic acid export membrane protein
MTAAVGESKNSRHVQNILQTAFANALIAALNVTTGVLLARLLGPTTRGELAAAQGFPLVLASLATLGLPQSVVYWVSREPEKSKQTLTTALLLFLPIIVLVLSAGYFLVPLALASQPDEVIRCARFSLLVCVNYTFGSVYTWVFQGLQDFKYWNGLRLFSCFVWLLAILSGHLTGRLSPAYLILFTFIFPLPSIFIFLRLAWKRLRGDALPSLKRARELLGYGFPITVSSIPQTLNVRLDQLAMAAWLPPQSLGLYAVGMSWSALIGVVVSAVGAVLFPVVSGIESQAERVRLAGAATRTSVLVVAVVACAMIAVTPLAIPAAFGAGFAPAVPPAIILVLASGLSSLSLVWKELLNGLGLTRLLVRAELVGAVCMGLGVVALLKRWGVMGAAVTAVLSCGATFAYLSWLLCSRLGVSAAELFLPTWSDYLRVQRKLVQSAKLALGASGIVRAGANQ